MSEERVAALEEVIRRLIGYAEEIERGIDFEGDAKTCARHIQTEGQAALGGKDE